MDGQPGRAGAGSITSTAGGGWHTAGVAQLSVRHGDGCDAFVGQLDRFVGVCSGLSDRELLASSRCWGWAVLEVVVHVRVGLQEMLGGMVSGTSDVPTPTPLPIGRRHFRRPTPVPMASMHCCGHGGLRRPIAGRLALRHNCEMSLPPSRPPREMCPTVQSASKVTS